MLFNRKGLPMTRFLLVLTFLGLTFLSAGAPAVSADSCGLKPIKPIPPIGCKDLIAQCVTDGNGHAHWQWICVKP